MSKPTWHDYCQQILHKLDQTNNVWKTTDICQHACIYGLDGYPWGWSPDCPELKKYTHQLDSMEGTTDVDVDEIDCAIQAGNGIRNPCQAGIRLGGKKYMFVAHDAGDKTT